MNSLCFPSDENKASRHLRLQRHQSTNWLAETTSSPTYRHVHSHADTTQAYRHRHSGCLYLSLNSGGADAGQVDGLVFSRVELHHHGISIDHLHDLEGQKKRRS